MRSGPASILVVEDEAAVALDVRSTLQRLGYGVPAAVGRGRDAIERASALRPDLVLMDIHLRGDMDGVETAQHVRQVLDIPVIYLTAYADPATLQRARVTEPYGYLLKPFHERELHIVIEMALYRHEMERRLRESERLTADDLPSFLWQEPPASTPAAAIGDGAGRAARMADDVRALQAVLRASDHNVSEAARRLGVHRSTIYRKLGRR